MSANDNIPHDQKLDNSITLIQEGYLFIKNRINRYQSDIFKARILGQNVICMSGENAAKVFYDPKRFTRKGAAPYRIQQSLFGVGAIQTLDDQEHRHRKKLFLPYMEIADQKRLGKIVKEEWEKAITKKNKKEINIFEEAGILLCRVACNWVGVPVEASKVSVLAEDFIAMVYAFGAIGPRHWKGRRARNKVENWLEELVKAVRNGKIEINKDSIMYSFTFHRDLDGNLLDNRMVAIEIMNILRPIVAISTYITFMILALHEHPEHVELLRIGTEEDLEAFVEEVRRFYPFGPFLAARVKEDFEWNDCTFNKGTLVLLDVYGTNHDNRIWEDANHFNPRNFHKRTENKYNFIPQGGGDPSSGHRCPGEGITVEVMKSTLDFFVNQVKYEVPAQDLSYPLNEMPTLPKSGFIISNVALTK
ncbi:cytochrome P450 [Salirhabdus sp. Marseille-P4669]|uniref:cytochrome P450 n=1 Tax=Salirhabdus sp. Marseille-P4669 TaxID=2042310 RepID=UPI001F24C1D5|nr:cytochrome P450 [Salirhabdus sp. Marseille-P4669]